LLDLLMPFLPIEMKQGSPFPSPWDNIDPTQLLNSLMNSVLRFDFLPELPAGSAPERPV
jgi:hypothetical protein